MTSEDLKKQILVELEERIDEVVVQSGGDCSFLLFLNEVVDRVRKGFRGDVSVMIDEFRVKKVEITERVNLDRVKDDFIDRMQNDAGTNRQKKRSVH